MEDTYKTIEGPSTGEYRDRGSKFLAYAYPAETEEEALLHLEMLRKEHPKARHHCFAYRLGLDGNRFRANDDGEPGGTAGRPILGQIDSFGLTNVVVIVVRYFGGTLLGTSGLIQAYRGSAAAALAAARVVERTVELLYALRFGYDRLGDVMSAIERLGLPMLDQQFGDQVALSIALPKSQAEQRLVELRARIAGISLDEALNRRELPQGVEINCLGER